jgi:hypothetical protein
MHAPSHKQLLIQRIFRILQNVPEVNTHTQIKKILVVQSIARCTTFTSYDQVGTDID